MKIVITGPQACGKSVLVQNLCRNRKSIEVIIDNFGRYTRLKNTDFESYDLVIFDEVNYETPTLTNFLTSDPPVDVIIVGTEIPQIYLDNVDLIFTVQALNKNLKPIN